jgi:hypothetical protein
MVDTPIKPSEDAVSAKDSAKAGLPKKLVQLIAVVRTKLRDFPELNRLVEGRETSDREIALAIAETVDDFNNTPPLIDSYGIENFPSVSLLIRGSIINVIESVGLLQTRNQMVYSDGEGVTVNVSDKTPMLLQWLQLFTNQYEAKKQRLKKALNLQGALNGTHLSSEYRYVDGLFDEY